MPLTGAVVHLSRNSQKATAVRSVTTAALKAGARSRAPGSVQAFATPRTARTVAHSGRYASIRRSVGSGSAPAALLTSRGPTRWWVWWLKSFIAQRAWLVRVRTTPTIPNNHPVEVRVEQSCCPLFDFLVPLQTERLWSHPIRWACEGVLDVFLWALVPL